MVTTTEDFDEADVLALIESALAEGPNTLQPERVLPIAMNEGRLLEILSSLLGKYMATPDVQVILDDLRDELYSGYDMGTLQNMHRFIKNCRKCPAMTPDPHMPSWNLVDPDVMFVADVPFTHSQATPMFVDSLKGAGFSSQRVMLTYVNRCEPKEKRRPNAEEIKTCNSYLHTEIQLVKPKLIVPMGLVPTAALLGTDVKMQDERGRVGWLGPWAILPTYSPTHVLKGAEYLRSNFEQDLALAYSFTYGER